MGTLPLIGTVSMCPAITTLRPAEIGAGDDGVALADHVQMAEGARTASSIRSASGASAPETLGMSQIARVISTDEAVRSSGMPPP